MLPKEKFGKHFWQEAETISGYQADTSMHEFEITEQDQLITVTVTNEKLPDSPQTALWLTLLGVSSAGIVGGWLFARKRRKDEEEGSYRNVN